MSARRIALALGLVLIALVLWIVGWHDRVVDVDGEEHVGRVRAWIDATHVVLRTRDGTEQTILVKDVRSVRRGLGGAFETLSKNPALFLAGMAIHLLCILTAFVRWRVLLAAAGLATPFRTVVRLGWVGQFFSSIIPGGVAGGDVVKAVYIAKTHAGAKTRAIVTVVMDRVVGLAMLCLLAAAAVLVAPEVSEAGAPIAWVLAGLGAAGLALFLLRGRLPEQGVLGEVRTAVDLYLRRPTALAGASGLALLGHGLLLAAFWFYGRALGIELPLLALGAAIPVAQMLAAVPLLPGGWGMADFAFYFFLPLAGVPAGEAVALSFVYRASHTLLSLPGGLMITRGSQQG